MLSKTQVCLRPAQYLHGCRPSHFPFRRRHASQARNAYGARRLPVSPLCGLGLFATRFSFGCAMLSLLRGIAGYFTLKRN